MKEIRIHKVMDEQICSIYFSPMRIEGTETDNWFINKAYIVGFIIGTNRRDNNDWFNSKRSCNKYNNVSTGNVGIRGLSWAIERVLEVVNQGHPIIIDGSDNRRHSCYCKMVVRMLGSLDVDTKILEDGSILIVKN